METEPVTIQQGKWKLRVQIPPGEGPHPVMLLVHGWTGDENSMWIFAGRLPKDLLLIAPRALYTTSLGGYSWHPNQERGWPTVEDLHPAVDSLLPLLTPANFPQGDFSKLRLAGFSQGAALVYTFVLLHPERVISFAGLSGFLPEGAGSLIERQPLKGKQGFIAHGALDDRVPVVKARQAVEQLEKAGALVTYCEDEVGHKLSANCFRGLEAFFKAN